ncbi:hypothetical protein ESZ50_04880 [Weissella muntiaci]|uniref:Uncharacterized protein n=1 Tax=Weissella muntiaci TaxID=2508881 RepID=A0A6C2C7S9_9LACO|nr:hypothetical protein [Weissella muntiaci]TYC49927.1 hypothetical protein ESZ50_04880 [Weissella muntiaci]
MKVVNSETGQVFEAWKVEKIGITLAPVWVREVISHGAMSIPANRGYSEYFTVKDGKTIGINLGDYILKGPRFSVIPVNRQEFEKTYKKVD